MKAILQTYTSIELKKMISQSNIKGYSKLKKNELIDLMTKTEHIHKFKDIKPKEKKSKSVATKAPVEKPKPKAPAEKKKEPNKKDEKEFSKNLLKRYNELKEEKAINGILANYNTKGKKNKGFLIINQLEQIRKPEFLNSLEKVAGKRGIQNTIVNANNYKNQIIKALYLDSIEDRGIYKKIFRTTSKFISNVREVEFRGRRARDKARK